MTSGPVPDLRTQVGAQLWRPARAWFRWQPALAVAVVLIALLAWWPARDPAPRDATTVARTPAVPSEPPASTVAQTTSSPAGPPARRPRRVEPREPWPVVESSIEPLALAALSVDPLDAGSPEYFDPVVVEPIAMEPLEVAPLDEESLTGRRQ